MEILILGNGFDLAHGLETTYVDFLRFVESFTNLVNNPVTQNSGELLNSDKSIYKYLNTLISQNRELYNELNQLLIDNIWIEYFSSRKTYINENWIDFESEISKVIRSLDSDMTDKNGNKLEITTEISHLSNEFLFSKYSKYSLESQSVRMFLNGNSESITFKEIRDRLQFDLYKLIRALEIYLSDYIEKKELPFKVKEMENIKPDHVLSFNYTATYQNNYDDMHIPKDKYDYIHGKTEINHTLETNNMVLGINEYLDNTRKETEIEFIHFKKYYQRILKETGSKYLDWLSEIEKQNRNHDERVRELKESIKRMRSTGDNGHLAKSNLENLLKHSPSHHVYIFGHSLDVTDKDILKAFICCDYVHTTIYYHDNDTRARQIANLVKVIGPDELIKRTGGPSKTIDFIKQQ